MRRKKIHFEQLPAQRSLKRRRRQTVRVKTKGKPTNKIIGKKKEEKKKRRKHHTACSRKQNKENATAHTTHAADATPSPKIHAPSTNTFIYAYHLHIHIYIKTHIHIYISSTQVPEIVRILADIFHEYIMCVI